MQSGGPISGAGKVLIVEDDPDVLGMAVSVVESMGFATISVRNGEDALQVLSDHDDVALVFSDLVLPGKVSGIKLVEEARRMLPDMPVILATGYLDESTEASDRIPKDIPLLQKPYRKAELAQAFARLGLS